MAGSTRAKIRPVGILRWLSDAPAVLVANPTAHSGKAADWIRIARELLDEVHVPHRFAATEPEGRTIDRVRELIDDDGVRVVMYMGGRRHVCRGRKGDLRISPRPRGRDGHATDRYGK